MIRKLTAAALGAATALVATSALAQDPAAAPAPAAASAPAAAASADTGSSGGLSAAVLLGYGFGSGGGGGESVNPYGLGLGARIGYTLPMNLYIGGTFVYHLGGSRSAGGGGPSVSYSTWYVAPEVGYEIAAGPVMVRPYVGIGLAEAHEGSVTVDGITVGGGSTSGVVFYPGATVLYPLTSNIGVGGDARFTIFSADGTSDNAFALFLTGQYRF